MNEIRIRATGAIVTEQEYKEMHPNISFAEGFTPSKDADRVHPSDPPEVGLYQRAVRDGIKRTGGKWVHKWKVENWRPDEITAHEAGESKKVRLDAKKSREKQVAGLIVKIGNKGFDGDEESQGRMLRKIFAMQETSAPTTMWTLADNSRVEVTLDELKQALAAAERAQSAIWATQPSA